MVCKNCGADTSEKAVFCAKCGARLGRAGGVSANRPAKAERIEPVGGRSADVPEEELWTGRYSPKAMTGAFVGLVLLTAIALVVASFAWPPGIIVVAIGTFVVTLHLIGSMLYQ